MKSLSELLSAAPPPAAARRRPSSKRAIREAVARSLAERERVLAEEAAAERARRSQADFVWSAPSSAYESAGNHFLRSVEEHGSETLLRPYIRVSGGRVSVRVPSTVGGEIRYAVHAAFAGSEHKDAWKPRNAFDEWADGTGGLDGPLSEGG